MAPTLGWIGTGKMGTALAIRLLQNGCDLSVWNRTTAKTAPLVEMGATAVDRPVDLASRQIVFVTIAGDQDLLEVLTGDEGIVTGDDSPDVVVDCSTVSAEVSERARSLLSEAGVRYLAAPISGNPGAVAAGNASIVVSGPQDSYETVRPVLENLTSNITWVGRAEQARLVKICHNLYLGMLAEALVEVTSLAEQGGVERSAFLNFLGGTVLGSGWINARSEALADRDYTPTFTLEMLRKDLNLGLAAAKKLTVPMPGAALVEQLTTLAIGQGHGSDDMLALAELNFKGENHD